MQDRVSKYPGRIQLTPVDTGTGIYDMEKADEPTQAGTELNKNSLLSANAESYVFGSSSGDHTVSQAFVQLKQTLNSLQTKLNNLK